MKQYSYEDLETSTITQELDRNWFNNTGCQYPLICPKGTQVKFRSIMSNYYGNWAEVECNGRVRYCFKCHLDRYIEKRKRTMALDRDGRTVDAWEIKMSNGEVYICTEELGIVAYQDYLAEIIGEDSLRQSKETLLRLSTAIGAFDFPPMYGY